jgi:predicted O-methyltransferase YrrM
MTANKAEALALISFAAERCGPMQGTSVEMSKYIEDGKLDFCFIDGDHSEDAVYRDAQAWFPKVRDGGALVFHDFQNTGGSWTRGVEPAVVRFSKDVGLTIITGTAFVCWILNP